MKSDSIWYSSLSTGIFEIDIQHSNIDQLIVILQRTKDKSRIKESMDILLHAVENHFKYEEVKYADNPKKMNQKHKDEHRRILKEYFDIANRIHISETEDITKELVGMMKIVLMNHVKDFDCKFSDDAS
jgi:hemerythrin-like metal-binding protein